MSGRNAENSVGREPCSIARMRMSCRQGPERAQREANDSDAQLVGLVAMSTDIQPSARRVLIDG